MLNYIFAVLTGLVVVLIFLNIYLLPTYLGRYKKAKNKILLFNLLLGWTGIGWGIALVMALKNEEHNC